MDNGERKMAATKFKKILTIDPGLSGTGYAYFYEGQLKICRQIIPDPKMTMEDKAFTIKTMILQAIAYFDIEEVFIEYPKVFGGATNYAIAMRGDIVKLAWLVGYLCGAMRTSKKTRYTLLPVNTWKGQLPKNVVENRVRKVYPVSNDKMKIEGHAIDAVGMGLYLQGKL